MTARPPVDVRGRPSAEGTESGGHCVYKLTCRIKPQDTWEDVRRSFSASLEDSPLHPRLVLEWVLEPSWEQATISWKSRPADMPKGTHIHPVCLSDSGITVYCGDMRDGKLIGKCAWGKEEELYTILSGTHAIGDCHAVIRVAAEPGFQPASYWHGLAQVLAILNTVAPGNVLLE